MDVPDRYVFGYGMDFQNQGRNLPAIHAAQSAGCAPVVRALEAGAKRGGDSRCPTEQAALVAQNRP